MQPSDRSLNEMLAEHHAAIVLQARMSSRRVPGKMLRKAGGKPLIEHVLARFKHHGQLDRVWLATSDDAADDPLALHGQHLGAKVYRGSLNDVAARLLGLARQESFSAIVRISADSPFMDVSVVRDVVALYSAEVDLATNVARRTFPKGQSVEMLRVSALVAAHAAMSPEDREHVTACFYKNPDMIRMVNLESGGNHGEVRMVVDTEDDWIRFEKTVNRLDSSVLEMDWKQIMPHLYGQ